MEMKGRPGEEPPNVMRHDATFYQMSPLTPMSQQKNVCIRSKKQFARSLTESVEKPARFTGRIFDGKREVVKFHSSACWRLATEDEVKQLELNARKTPLRLAMKVIPPAVTGAVGRAAVGALNFQRGVRAAGRGRAGVEVRGLFP